MGLIFCVHSVAESTRNQYGNFKVRTGATGSSSVSQSRLAGSFLAGRIRADV